MSSLNLRAQEIITFIPGGERYDEALQFYKEIGFVADFSSPQLSLLRKDTCRFFLQNYQNAWAHDNFMMVLDVENLDDWWSHLSGLNLPEKYKEVSLKAPEDYPWGKREIHLIDPCGVLWHISVPA